MAVKTEHFTQSEIANDTFLSVRSVFETSYQFYFENTLMPYICHHILKHTHAKQ